MFMDDRDPLSAAAEAETATDVSATLRRPQRVGRRAGAAVQDVPDPGEVVETVPVPLVADLDDPALYLNRELTWLAFNRRVLHEAEDSRTPLLERLKFLAIVAANLDEFFMKRIGGLKQQVAAGVQQRTVDGRTPHEQIRECAGSGGRAGSGAAAGVAPAARAAARTGRARQRVRRADRGRAGSGCATITSGTSFRW